MGEALHLPRQWSSTSAEPNIRANFVIALGCFALTAVGLLSLGKFDSPILHTILDTAILITSLMLALLLWDLGRRIDEPFAQLLAITFTFASGFELVHTVVALEGVAGIIRASASQIHWRAGTWGPPACLIPAALLAALLLPRAGRHPWLFSLGLLLISAALFALFQWLPRYTAPYILGITRPSLLPSPLLWAGVGIAYHYRRARNPALTAIPALAVLMLLANTIQTYSMAPNDPI